MLDEDLTLAVAGTVENHWLQDYDLFGIGTAVRSRRFELGPSLFDAVPGTRSAESGVSDRRLDGSGIALGARVPEPPWAWIRARKQGQIPVDSDQVTRPATG